MKINARRLDAEKDVPAHGTGVSRRSLFTSVATGVGLSVLEPVFGALPAFASAPALPGLDPNKYGDAKQTAEVLAITVKELDQAISFKNAGNLLRLAFHDSGTFNGRLGTGGANGSIAFETSQSANGGLLFGVNLMKRIKKKIDAQSPVPIGFADLVALAGARSVKVTGGPDIKIPVGRPDVTVADPPGMLPSETLTADGLKKLFADNGYSVQDLVALSGAHTIGISRTHPPVGLPLDIISPNTFDTKYFQLLLNPEKPLGFFPSDNALVTDPETKAYVVKFANDKQAFFKAFSDAYLKLTLKGVEPTSA
ncbi:L-ascorbate peroxidase [Klebsormidium nitens]|uniref:L-ascorbate peroxidase n=1 Tax=Klebsormidium nitens TaxID=105231 RepID=A0A1Y1HMH8_KLENI|nr:L-ascorbate peroxidase [Klebsormidium nitens]|eukprot:GAQ79820.1 L-ascorbate peroxidase [Klebsormidium nitens]